MLITLNEYTLALLCGSVSCLTYIVIHMNDIGENDLTGKKKKRRISESDSMEEDLSPMRRHSQISARFRGKRAESIKNDHVMFADEIKDDDEKFTPNIGVQDEEVEGILQNTEGGIDVKSIEDFEVPPLNTFDKSQPLDDLLIRRRSLHSSPANSRSGSRSGSVRISAPEDGENSDDDHADDAVDFQVRSLRSEVASLREDLSSLQMKDDELAKEKAHLESLLKMALGKLFPDKMGSVGNHVGQQIDDAALEDYLQKL